VIITDKGIAWPHDIGKKFKNLPGSKKDDQWIDVETGSRC